jgi:hypothetical protein
MMSRRNVNETTRAKRKLLIMLATLVMVAGLLTSGFAGGAASAATITYGYWHWDGCYYVWTGPSKGFGQNGCGPSNQVTWSEGSTVENLTVHTLLHFENNKWQFQGYSSSGTMDTPNGILIVPYVSQQEEHVFVIDYADMSMYHFRKVLQAVQAVPVGYEVETTSGWSAVADPRLDSMLDQWEQIRPK